MVRLTHVIAVLACVATVWAATNPIEHVIVIMLENRSFDHMLGWLHDDISDIDGLKGNECNYLNVTNPAQGKQCVTRDAKDVDPDPSHSVTGTTEQVFGSETAEYTAPPPMNGFAQNGIRHGIGSKAPLAMFTKETAPVINTLAKEFAVFDRWFASVPGPTEVNRAFLHSATSHGMATNDFDQLAIGLPQKTIFQSLEESNKTWTSYYADAPTTLFYRHVRTEKRLLNNFKPFERFEEDVSKGELPHYAFVEPRYFDIGSRLPANDQHPSHDVSAGEALLKKVYEAVRASPKWNETLLLITYDEHGGFYDHTPTPVHAVPSPDGRVSKNPAFAFDRLGVRVPTIAISPRIHPGVVHEPTSGSGHYEHSSLCTTLKDIFGLSADFLTARDAWAGSFAPLIDTTNVPRTDCPLTLPTPPETLRRIKPLTGTDTMSDWQCSLVVTLGGRCADHPTETHAACFVLRATDRLFHTARVADYPECN